MVAYELKHQMIFCLIHKDHTECTREQLQMLHSCIECVESVIKVSEFELLANLPKVVFMS